MGGETIENGRRDLSVSMAKANLYGLIVLPAVALLGVVFLFFWGCDALLDGSTFDGSSPSIVVANVVGFAVAEAAGVVAHEAIHDLSWA